MVFSMRLVIKTTIALVGIALLLWFKFEIADPALQPRVDGHYGEMYGPVIALQWPIYGALAIASFFGIAIALSHRKPHEMS